MGLHPVQAQYRHPGQVAALTADVRNVRATRTPRSSSTRKAAGCSGCGRRIGRSTRRAAFGQLYDIDQALGLKAARLSARLIADDLAKVGVTVDCLPLADVPVPGADDVIGDRAYGEEPKKVAAIARAVTQGLEEGGILPILKHIPGHGRATADSHLKLPVVDTPRSELESIDLRPSNRSRTCRWR